MKVTIKKAQKGRWDWRIENENERLASGHAPSEKDAKAAVGQYLAKARQSS